MSSPHDSLYGPCMCLDELCDKGFVAQHNGSQRSQPHDDFFDLDARELDQKVHQERSTPIDARCAMNEDGVAAHQCHRHQLGCIIGVPLQERVSWCIECVQLAVHVHRMCRLFSISGRVDDNLDVVAPQKVLIVGVIHRSEPQATPNDFGDWIRLHLFDHSCDKITNRAQST
jgi:hypothetical protein